MLREIALSTAVAAGLAGFSFAAQDQPGQMPGQGREMRQPGQAQQLRQEAAQRLVRNVYSANLLQAQLGQQVAQKTQDPQIKQLAQQMAREHQQKAQQLKQTAQQIGIQVEDQLNPVDKAIYEHITALPADQIGQEYLFYEIGAHHKAIAQLQYVAEKAQNDRLKQFASQTARSLQQHLQNVQQVAEAHFGVSGPVLMGQMPGGQDSGREQKDWQKQDQHKQDWQRQGQPGQPGQQGQQGGQENR